MRRKVIPYDSKLKELARALRNNSTMGETLLWKHIRGKQMLGYDFHRQRPVGKYIVDFFCPELMLGIELDGFSHENEDAFAKDDERQKNLESLGLTILRFKETEVRKDIRSVLERIEYWIRNRHTPVPSR